jgi:hypothetical protein
MELNEWVPWVIGLGNVCSALLVGDKHNEGWIVLAVTQGMFAVYGIATGQIGFVLQLLMILVALVNYNQWNERAKNPYEIP